MNSFWKKPFRNRSMYHYNIEGYAQGTAPETPAWEEPVIGDWERYINAKENDGTVPFVYIAKKTDDQVKKLSAYEFVLDLQENNLELFEEIFEIETSFDGRTSFKFRKTPFEGNEQYRVPPLISPAQSKSDKDDGAEQVIQADHNSPDSVNNVSQNDDTDISIEPVNDDEDIHAKRLKFALSSRIGSDISEDQIKATEEKFKNVHKFFQYALFGDIEDEGLRQNITHVGLKHLTQDGLLLSANFIVRKEVDNYNEKAIENDKYDDAIDCKQQNEIYLIPSPYGVVVDESAKYQMRTLKNKVEETDYVDAGELACRTTLETRYVPTASGKKISTDLYLHDLVVTPKNTKYDSLFDKRSLFEKIKDLFKSMFGMNKMSKEEDFIVSAPRQGRKS